MSKTEKVKDRECRRRIDNRENQAQASGSIITEDARCCNDVQARREPLESKQIFFKSEEKNWWKF